MKNTEYYHWDNFIFDVERAYNLINDSQFNPKYIIGLTRGGSILSTCLSYAFNIPVFYFDPKKDKLENLPINFSKDKILIVDEINDTGKTFKTIRKNIIKLLHPECTEIREEIFSLDNIKFLVIFNNINSISKVDYFIIQINKTENDWIVFPWE